MSSSLEPLIEAQKLKILRQIQAALYREEHPTLRACGLSEEIAQAVACEPQPEPIVDLWIVEDEGPVMDRCRVRKISDIGLGILARGDGAEPSPMQVTVVPPKRSIYEQIRQATRSGSRDLVKVAFGAIVGWFLKKHFGQ